MLPYKQYQRLRDNEDRIRILDGDIQKPQLGLSENTMSEIQSTATIYIHSASSINLRRPLPSIATSVIEPSLQLAEIALASPQLQTFAYISTAYANAHLHNLHTGIETPVSEAIHPLRSSGGDSTALEYEDLLNSGTTPEYTHHSFPFPYAYAKHLTERLLIQKFSSHAKGSPSLLILRPSIIGPALREPFPYYEIRSSAPATSVCVAFLASLSLNMRFASRFPDPFNQSNFDEVPVDIVVNRLLMHLSRRTEGCVHAVAGQRARRSFASVWEKAMSVRRLPWTPRLVWKDVDWRDPKLHAVARAFVILGTSFLFEDAKVDRLWTDMTEQERSDFPLWLESPQQNEDMAMRKVAWRNVLQKWVAKNGMSDWVVDVLVKGSEDARKWWLLWLW